MGGEQWQRPQRLLVRAPQWIVILTGSRPQIAEYKPLQVPYWWHIVLVLVLICLLIVPVRYWGTGTCSGCELLFFPRALPQICVLASPGA